MVSVLWLPLLPQTILLVWVCRCVEEGEEREGTGGICGEKKKEVGESRRVVVCKRGKEYCNRW